MLQLRTNVQSQFKLNDIEIVIVTFNSIECSHRAFFNGQLLWFWAVNFDGWAVSLGT